MAISSAMAKVMQMVLDSTETLGEEEKTLLILESTLLFIQTYKPNDRSDKDRIYAMVISDLQKAVALFEKYVVRAQ